MKGAYIFVVFFLIFTSAMLLIPLPMFPGNAVLALANASVSEYSAFFSALINGIFYGFAAWAIFVVMMQRIENASSKNPRKNHDKKRSTR